MNNLIDFLGIKINQIKQSEIIISLEVTDAVKQPYGFLHGGINAVMAETAASIGANQNVGENQIAVGVDITTHHLKPVSSGTIYTKATPIHIGNHIQTWYTETTFDHQLTSVSTVTLSSMAKPK